MGRLRARALATVAFPVEIALVVALLGLATGGCGFGAGAKGSIGDPCGDDRACSHGLSCLYETCALVPDSGGLTFQSDPDGGSNVPSDADGGSNVSSDADGGSNVPSDADGGSNVSSDADGVDAATTMLVPCDEGGGIPANATVSNPLVTVTYTDAGIWTDAELCGWTCNADYLQEGNSCINSREEPCVADHSNPANSEQDDSAIVTVTYTDAGGWTDPGPCPWTCVAGFQRNGAGTACVDIPMYIFDGGGVSGALGGRFGADALCQATKQQAYAALPGTTVHAFISVRASDEIRDMPARYGVPTGVAIVGPTGASLASDWGNLLNGGIDRTLQDASVLVDTLFWYSGSVANGMLALHCSNWTSPFANAGATYGVANATNGWWINRASAACGSADYHVLCLSYAP